MHDKIGISHRLHINYLMVCNHFQRGGAFDSAQNAKPKPSVICIYCGEIRVAIVCGLQPAWLPLIPVRCHLIICYFSFWLTRLPLLCCKMKRALAELTPHCNVNTTERCRKCLKNATMTIVTGHKNRFNFSAWF